MEETVNRAFGNGRCDETTAKPNNNDTTASSSSDGAQPTFNVQFLIFNLSNALLSRPRSADGLWTGCLSSSPISTAVAVFALHTIDRARYAEPIRNGAAWLLGEMRADGSWGDSPESPSNLTATLLTYAALTAVGQLPAQSIAYLEARFGGSDEQHLIEGVLRYYGKDLTFSVPILVMCALAGIIRSWKAIPRFPFQAALIPQRFFRYLRLPVVSYAIPALIAVGILQYKRHKVELFQKHHKRRPLSRGQLQRIDRALTVLQRLQPAGGGFLEAPPLTGFVSMCLSAAGYSGIPAVQACADFLVRTVRPDGSWPIDTNLSGWVTSLSVRALGADTPNPEALAETIINNAFRHKHPFTGAAPGGWGWTNLSGAVPDGDDTAGALVALHILLKGAYRPEIGSGIEWLLGLQNSDGGMPTFCKGWGKLPFDRSSADISAHALCAFRLWAAVLPDKLQRRVARATRRLLRWMKQHRAADGSWTPLWFGDQDAADEQSPVYGTATTIAYLAAGTCPDAQGWAADAQTLIADGISYLLTAQNVDGGWGGAAGAPSKVTLTARALCALASCTVFRGEDGSSFEGKTVRLSRGRRFVFRGEDGSSSEAETVRLPSERRCVSCEQWENAVQQAVDYLLRAHQRGALYQPEPIGLYFSRLWYSEELYNLTFVLEALKKLKIENPIA
ncbi:MAG: squalene--hopene cyclase [Prevotellaceae bacterium]|nr:squalene--hopene cyclase [Prevotellaceae bacterium]